MLGNTSIWGDLTVNGAFDVTDNLTVVGNWTFNGGVYVNQDLTVYGNTDINGALIQEGDTCTFDNSGAASLTAATYEFEATLDSSGDTGMNINAKIIQFDWLGKPSINFPPFSLTVSCEYCIPLNPPYPYIQVKFAWVPSVSLSAWAMHVKGLAISPLPSLFSPLTLLEPSVLLTGEVTTTSGELDNTVEALGYIGVKVGIGVDTSILIQPRLDISATFCCVRFYCKLFPDLQIPGTGSIDLLLDPAAEKPGFDTLAWIDSSFIVENPLAVVQVAGFLDKGVLKYGSLLVVGVTTIEVPSTTFMISTRVTGALVITGYLQVGR